jgi:hypothetical protein
MSERPWPNAAAFLADERTSFQPYEAILELDLRSLGDGPQAHGWSARDVLSHIVGWHEVATVVARELMAGPTSPRKAAADADWEARGDEINEEIRRAWQAFPLESFRTRARAAAADLRAALAEVPPERWWDNAEYFDYFNSEMQAHYDDHRADLEQVLGRATD